jgi:hypothetical protein
MATRLMITLNNDEAVALGQMADQDLREPREHLRFLLQEEARKRGLLPANQCPEKRHQVQLEQPSGTR